jgi:hypothetical protein
MEPSAAEQDSYRPPARHLASARHQADRATTAPGDAGGALHPLAGAGPNLRGGHLDFGCSYYRALRPLAGVILGLIDEKYAGRKWLPFVEMKQPRLSE